MANSNDFLRFKKDTRPAKGGWAMGPYLRTCSRCKDDYFGDKRSFICADCTYELDTGFTYENKNIE